MSWNEERVTKLKELWAEGKTAAHIAKVLGDVTRNAVIGKAHRLGLSNRASALKSASAEPKEPSSKLDDTPKKTDAQKAVAAKASAPSAASEASKLTRAVSAASKQAAPKRPKTAEAVEELEAEELIAPESEELEEGGVNPIAARAAEVERTSRRLNLLELNERTCKWPIGDPSTDDFYFCGHPCAPDKPYCAAHVQVAYQPMSSRRDRDRERARSRAAIA